MDCTSVKEQASLFIDGQLLPSQNQEFIHHVNSCDVCYRLLQELKRNCIALASLRDEAPPRHLVESIKARIDEEHRNREQSLGAWLGRLLTLDQQATAYVASFILTCMLFTGVIYGLKPTFRFSKEIEDRLIVAFSQPSMPLHETMPSVESAAAIVELTFIKPNPATERDLFVVAEVSDKGRAKLIQVVGASNNPILETRVDQALKRASFKPATKAGKPVNSRMLLLIETIDVRG